MASWWKKTIFIALIIAIAIPTSLAHKRRFRRSDDSNSDDAEQYLRDLCSETDRSDACLNIVKSELHRFNHVIGDINDKIIDLALEKSEEFRDQLKQWHKDSNDERLKEKYRSCSSNYNDINRDLQELQRNLDSDDDRKTSDLIEDIEHELDECKREFGQGSFDPGHVEDRNNELGIYSDLVRVAIDRLEDFYKETNHQ
ncbi:hypothetical protein SASPL_146059 [Salvia splendens]|uniref:Pectinesterase inhibitor domain-containing protein n=1 Tax=Salvia splendens TaxID=180675 RepID=A0A8X8Z8X7_SALSN|nr:hypothetical protein SASPL_146059 [Salvia splendens]